MIAAQQPLFIIHRNDDCCSATSLSNFKWLLISNIVSHHWGLRLVPLATCAAPGSSASTPAHDATESQLPGHLPEPVGRFGPVLIKVPGQLESRLGREHQVALGELLCQVLHRLDADILLPIQQPATRQMPRAAPVCRRILMHCLAATNPLGEWSIAAPRDVLVY